MHNFTFDFPRVLFGFGQLENLHNEKLPGKKALVVISAGKSTKASGALAKLEKELDLAGVEHVLYDKIQPNPTRISVDEGAALAKETGCDFVIGLGGGSSMDAAKAIALMMTNPGSIWDYAPTALGGNKAPEFDAAPSVCITTTAGTGSEVDPWSVITDEALDEKSGLGTTSMMPKIAVVDPELMMTIPPFLTACQGMDAFFHASESVINTKNHEMGRMFAMKAIELVAKYLPIAVKDGSNKEARYYMALANTLAGYYMVCTSAHQMEHALGSYYHELTHGAGLIVIAHEYYKFFADREACEDKMIAMAKAMGKEDAKCGHDFVAALDELLDSIGCGDLKMSDYGITEESLDKVPKHVREVLGGDITADPIIMSDEDYLGIFKRSYK